MRAGTLGQHRSLNHRPWLGVLLSLAVLLGIPWALAWHSRVHVAEDAGRHGALPKACHALADHPGASAEAAGAAGATRGRSDENDERHDRPGHPCTVCLDLLFATISQVMPEVAPPVGIELLIAVDAHAPTRRLTAQDRRLVAAPRGPPGRAA